MNAHDAMNAHNAISADSMATGLSPKLKAVGLDAGYEKKIVVEGLNLEIAEGSVISIIGPNGSGKSTILKTLARMLRPIQGVVLLDAKNMRGMKTAEIARQLAALPQTHGMPDEARVYDIVSYGRFPHKKSLGSDKTAHKAAIARALDVASIAHLAQRPLASLSGGERQRVWIAMTLAQEPRILLLDEPTTFLDIRFQLEILDLVRRLNRESSITVIMTLHDLNHAARYSNRIIALKQGKIAADGTPTEILRPDLLAHVFGVEGSVLMDDGTPYFVAKRAFVKEPNNGVA